MNTLQAQRNSAKRRLTAILLCICLIITFLPSEFFTYSVYGKEISKNEQRTIVSFSDLPADIKLQNVDTGTSPENLKLPDTLEAVCHSSGEEDQTAALTAPGRELETAPETETSKIEIMDILSAETTETETIQDTETKAPESLDTASENHTTDLPKPPQRETIHIEDISWAGTPKYDCETEGTYTFTPILPKSYTLADGVTLPEITVIVEAPHLTEFVEIKADGPASSPTCGTITQNTTWSGGTLNSGTLTIEPGVTLTINGHLTINGNVIINGGGTIVRGNASALFLVSMNCSLSLSNITLEGASVPSSYSFIEVNGGKITLDDGCHIQNFFKNGLEISYKTDGSYGGGSVLCMDDATAIFNNAIIENCSSISYGGAMFARKSKITINSGTYKNNKTTSATIQHQGTLSGYGGGFFYNAQNELAIYGGNFINNTSAGKGGCIFDIGYTDSKTYLHGGYFEGNQSTYPGYEGSGAIFYLAHASLNLSSDKSIFDLSSNVHFSTGSATNGMDSIYLDLDLQRNLLRKIQISSSLNYPVDIYLQASEGYVIAEGREGYILQERDMKKIFFHDIGNSAQTWYPVLNKETNQVVLSTTNPQYGLYVTYISNGAQGTVTDNNRYADGDTVTVKSGENLIREGCFFDRWNTKADGSGEFYQASDEFEITEDTSLYATFKETLTAVFYSGGAGQSESIEIADKTVTTPALKQMAGWIPVGWERDNTKYAGDIAPDFELTIEGSTAFYGIYKQEVTLSYDAQGGDVTPPAETDLRYANVHNTITFQSPSLSVAAGPSRIGYVFAGWNTQADGTGTSYPAGSSFTLEQDTVLYAEWEPVDTPYLVEHYKQDITGDGYTRDISDTEHLTALLGETVTADPKDYDGFTENTSHTSRIPSGTVTADGSLILKLYYDRDVYEIAFDLNGGHGVAPDTQTVRFGGLLESVEEPVRRGYHFIGWYMDTEGTNDCRWDFDKTVENNTEERKITLYAKWVDDIAPVLEEASFNTGYKDLFHWIIRKKSLIITVPVIEEGSGVKEASYTLLPNGTDTPAAAKVSSKRSNNDTAATKKADIITQDGQTAARLAIDEDFSGRIILVCSDQAGNISAEKSVTAEDGGIIVEDNAPEIGFSVENGDLFEWFYDSVSINVHVSDDSDNVVSGGISRVAYRIDSGQETEVENPNFDNGIVTSYEFVVAITDAGEHTLSVTAVDHAGNESTRQVSVTIRNRQANYTVEHYLQNVEGNGYTKAPETEYLTGTIGDTVTAKAKIFAGFTENTGHTGRKSSGTVREDGTLTLSVYYDRDVYEVHFDLNGADQTAPKTQRIRYGGFVQTVDSPTRKGYSFKGWYMDKNGTQGNRWDFERSVETNSTSRKVTLYAKWVDDIAPVLGKVSFNKGYTNLSGWIIRKKNLIITIPVTEEGSGVKEAAVKRMPQKGISTKSTARIKTENGKPVLRIAITEDFKGTVTVTCSDKAGNISTEKNLTSQGGGLIVEDNAPEISFSSENGALSDLFTDTASVCITVKDDADGSQVTGGIAAITYCVDGGRETSVSGKNFENSIVTNYQFTVDISTPGKHSLSVTAIDHAGNTNTRQTEVEIRGVAENPPAEPKTADTVHVEIYATLAMVAGFAYLLLYFTTDIEEMTQEEARRRISALAHWAAKGGKLRKLLAFTAIFFLLAYYYSVGKLSTVKWEKLYHRK